MKIEAANFKIDSNVSSVRMSKYSHLHAQALNNKPTLKPLNSENVSFKGFLFVPVTMKNSKTLREFNAVELLKLADEHLGRGAREVFERIKDSPHARNLISANDERKVTFKRKHTLMLIYDGIIYPFKVMPCDILGGILKLAQKIKPLEKWAENAYNTPFLENMRQRVKIDAEVNSIRGLFETIQDTPNENLSDKLFVQSIKMFDLKTGHYDTKHERSLNRIVSGSIPAIFLANDAYNLAMMSSNKKDKSIQTKDAKKEAKTRFNQEVTRVGLTAYLQLITFGALQKYINNSSAMVMLNTGITVLITEAFSRIANGKYITKLTPEEAKAINAKNKLKTKNSSDIKTEAQTDKSSNNLNPQSLNTNNKIFSTVTGFKGDNKTEEEKKQEPLLSFNTLIKASAFIIAFGIGTKILRAKIPTLDKMLESFTGYFNNIYNNLTTFKDYKMKESEFDSIVQTLKENGFSELATKYKDISKRILEKDGEYLKLGEKDRPIKPLINFILSPFRSIYTAIRFPYTLSEKIQQVFTKSDKNPNQEIIDDKKLKEALLKSIDKMKIITHNDMTPQEAEKFKKFVNDNILRSFNKEDVSNISNNKLANLAKTSATASTLWFLMTDNYNMVMLKSDGEDKKGAEERFKARFVQEMSRLFYQTALIDLFNTTFVNPYHSSLFGMSWVTLLNTLIGEVLNRKSIGMPVLRHSKEELTEIDNKKANATGALKSYYDFMAKLTGKKTLAEQKVKNNEN